MSTYIGPDKILNKRQTYLFPATGHFYQNPPQLVQGYMQYLYDTEGKKYVDFFAGVSVINCGHCNEEIVKATVHQIEKLQHTCTLYLTEPIVNLAERLASLYPGDINRSFFCVTGSEANEGALLTARLYTGKKKFIAMDTGLHGRTSLTMKTTGIPMWRTDPFLEDEQDVFFIDNIDGIQEDLETQAKQALLQVEAILKAHHSEIAAMIVEPIQGNGGILMPPLWYFKSLKKLLEAYQVLLIVDEIQTGFARTGKMFGIEHFDVVPDIMTIAKALGNGIPISAFATTDAIANTFIRPSASTFGGNPVAAATALAVLDYIENHQLARKAEDLGNYLHNELKKLSQKHTVIKSVRGTGLMQGIELRMDNKPAPELTDLILEKMKDKGFLIGKNGLSRNCLAFQPPLIIDKNNITDMLIALDQVLLETNI